MIPTFERETSSGNEISAKETTLTVLAEQFQPNIQVGEGGLLKRSKGDIDDLTQNSRILVVSSNFLEQRFTKNTDIVATLSFSHSKSLEEGEMGVEGRQTQDIFHLIAGNITPGSDIKRISETIREIATPTAGIHLNIYHKGEINSTLIDQVFTEAGIYIQGLENKETESERWIELDGMNPPKDIFASLAADRKGI